MNKSQGSQRAMYGHMWKFAKDPAVQVAAPQAPTAPVIPQTPPVEPTGQNGDIPSTNLNLTDSENESQDNEPKALSDEELKALSVDQLQEIASSLGVANINQKKDKLIEAIKQRQ
ncbi:MAG: Rho termination factor N-terminal domain-containing protein [Pseudobdellovibrionaceae bacterium]